MFKPYFKYVDAPGTGGRVTGMWFNRSWYSIIRSEEQQVSRWSKPVENSYRDLQSGGVTLGLFGQNYWIVNDTILGKLLSWL